MFLTYEDTFEGLLSALAFALKRGSAVHGIHPESRRQILLGEPVQVPTRDGILEKFERYLTRAFGPDALEFLFHASLSEQEDIEMRMLGYLRTGIRLGRDPSDMLQQPDVAAVRAAARAVTMQSHMYTGLLRFRKRHGLYVADFEPDYRLLPLLTPHFADRMPGTPFLIRDRRRCRASACRADGVWHIFLLDPDMPEEEQDLPDVLSPEEAGWQAYFSAVAVPERINPELQRSNMPKKYWKYLIERPGR